MKARILNYSWTDKPQLSRDAAFIGILVLLGAVAFFKLKPYFTETPKVVAYNSRDSRSEKSSKEVMNELRSQTLDGSKAETGGPTSLIDRYLGLSSAPSSPGERAQPTRSTRPRIIERPLFDNLTVTLKGVLVQGYSSAQGDNAVEARVQGLGEENPPGIEIGPVDGASLVGTAGPNFELKRVNLQFSELITRDGKRFAVSGVVIDPATKTLGVVAHYSSGMTSRLLGVGLGKAIGTTDQLVRSRVLENEDDSDPISRELRRGAVDSGGQAANELGQEATRDLRETKAELSLGAGTPITIKLRASSGGRGGL